MNELKRRVEAYLFIISKGLPLHELAEKTGASEKDVETSINELQKEYDDRKSAFSINNFNNLYRMTVDRTLLNGLDELVPREFNKSIMKTLSVVAWKEGITQGQVVRIRGNKAYEHIKQLLELGFLTSEPYGNSFKLMLANKFFEYFNISRGEEKFIFKQFNE
ncbi:MAG: SMC-Scp complex subunit ScpB [Nanoarchaeota archaeon]|nr:SMC-Scp complex subunit ScpB [Nanoarchaeota archaeon]